MGATPDDLVEAANCEEHPAQLSEVSRVGSVVPLAVKGKMMKRRANPVSVRDLPSSNEWWAKQKKADK